VYAVPGARRNPAAAGCNALIADGAGVLLDPGDLLLALGKGRAGCFWSAPAAPPDDPDEQRVLAAFAGAPADTDLLLTRTGLGPDRLAGALRRLQQTGRIDRHRTQWWAR
jgi:DNA processing protein